VAVDADFLGKKSEFQAKHSILIFARATPEAKMKIVAMEKEKIARRFKKQSFLKRLAGRMIPKVGMVGDGANDLMAIK
jgi:soluble P-type ATPase